MLKKMGRFQSCRSVVEKALRRSFYDGVLELYDYEGNQNERVTCVALEGTLTLTINKSITFAIRLNEIAQRAEEVIDDVLEHRKSSESSLDIKKRARKIDSGFERPVKIKKEVKGEKHVQEEKRSESYSPAFRSNDNEKETFSNVKKSATLPKQTQVLLTKIARADLHPHEFSSPNPAVGELETSCTSYINILPVVVPSPPAGTDTSQTCDFDQEPSQERSEKRTELSSQRSSHWRHNLHPFEGSVTVKKEPQPEPIIIEDDDSDQDPFMSSQSDTQHLLIASQHLSSDQDNLKVKVYKDERCDCAVCGEVLHGQRALTVHLRAHQIAFESTCHICQTDNLTLEALQLHLRLMHSPCIFPLPASVTAEGLVGRAVLPALVSRQGSLSAIASLVNMASSQMMGGSAAAGAAVDPGAAFGVSGGALGAAAATSNNRIAQVVEQLFGFQNLMVKCDTCDLLFSSKQALSEHVAIMHGMHALKTGIRRENRCELERDDTRCDDARQEDNEQSSPENADFTCFDCSLAFVTYTMLTQHCIQQHGSTAVPSHGSCTLCHKTFDMWKTLRTHYTVFHRISCFCESCKQGFTSSEELKTHYETHAHETRSMAFVCDICNKGFYSQSQCSAHKRSHISEKSFACQVCGSAFFKRGDLSKHFRTVHAPNRVFACRFCGKRGTRMDNMRSHVRSHGKHMTRDEILSMIEEAKS